LCSISYVLNKKKQFNIGNKTDMKDHNEL